MDNERLLLFSGTANKPLAAEIATCLDLAPGEAMVESYQDGETRVQIQQNVRGADVFVLQPTCPPVDSNLMQLLIMIDALRRASAGRITAVIPYFGYAKQEKKSAGREPITAKLVANLITTAGANRILTMDLHSAAIEGFFDIPVDHLRAAPMLAAHIAQMGLPNVVVVSPDSGGVHRAYEFRSHIGSTEFAFIAKHRRDPETPEILEMVGEVGGCSAVIVDDMIQSGGTIIECARELAKRGAMDIYVCATHAVFADHAMERIRSSRITRAIVTNTIPVGAEKRCEKIDVISIAPLLAETIQRIHQGQSLSTLFPHAETQKKAEKPVFVP
jgi:ribose-phosphate pyrophosphokinase